MATRQKKTRRRSKETKTARSDDREIVLICNPQAGGRWRELANILDSPEARGVRRIVTDSIEDIGPALAGLGRGTQLVCIYGGDGTIQRILDKMYRDKRIEPPRLAFIGGGTMNVTARWCGLRDSPGDNFREIVKAYNSDQLLLKEVPLLEVRQGEALYHGFTFGVGPIIRILHEYERGSKGKAAALGILAKSVVAIWSRFPAEFQPLLEEMNAEVLIDGKPLPYQRFSAMFCNVTGRLNIGVNPFTKMRTRDTFYTAAYAVTRREFILMFPFLIRGHLPVDPKSLLNPVSTWKQIAMSYLGKGSFPVDPRYINETASSFELRAAEAVFTVDGEIITSTQEPISVRLGPVVKLAVSPTVGLGPTTRLAAGVTRLR
jgi:hypothetical protein